MYVLHWNTTSHSCTVFDATNLQTDLLTVTGSGREAHGERLAEARAIASRG